MDVLLPRSLGGPYSGKYASRPRGCHVMVYHSTAGMSLINFAICILSIRISPCEPLEVYNLIFMLASSWPRTSSYRRLKSSLNAVVACGLFSFSVGVNRPLSTVKGSMYNLTARTCSQELKLATLPIWRSSFSIAALMRGSCAAKRT